MPYSGSPAISLSVFQIRSSIRSKIVVSFVAIAVVAITVVSVVGYLVARDVVEKTVMADLGSIAAIQSERLERLVAQSLESLSKVTTDTRTRNRLRSFGATGDHIDRNILTQIVTERANNLDDVESIDIHNLSGEIVASSQWGRTGRNDFDPSRQGLTFNWGHDDSASAESDIHISGPIEFEGQVIGYATLHLPGESLRSVSANYTGLRETGEITLVTHDTEGAGRFVTPVRDSTAGVFSGSTAESDQKLVELAALTGTSGGGSDFTDYRGERVYAVYKYIESANIGLIVKMDRSEALSRFSANMGAFILTLPLLLLGVIITALIVARQLLNPITHLTRSVERFSRGEFDSRVSVESSDEIGTLAETFNAMALSIQESNSKLEERVEQRTAELQRSNQDLEQFAYVASHDLQEPLRMVSSYTQLLSRRYAGKLDSDADEFIDFAVDGAKRMQTLINALLTYSRVGRHNSDYATLNASDVVNEAIENLHARVTDAGAIVSVADLPSLIADRQQLLSLFQNLIDNAIKYRSSERSPHIWIDAERTGSAWQFSVKDNGIGIDSAYTDKIFTIFQRLHRRDEYPGTGIGLAVAKKIVERAGGRIWLTSVPGEGSTFYFTVIDRIPVADTKTNEERAKYHAAS
ncbi:MAG: HAMP domain-containing protein [Chloroflexi bacterium]|nr:HAMP domain-containing protein [Chloroflexota bacterium]